MAALSDYDVRVTLSTEKDRLEVADQTFTVCYWLKPDHFKFCWTKKVWYIEQELVTLKRLQLIKRVCEEKERSLYFDDRVRRMYSELLIQAKKDGLYEENSLPYSEELYAINDMVHELRDDWFRATHKNDGVVLYVYDGKLCVRGTVVWFLEDELEGHGFVKDKAIISWCKQFDPADVEFVKGLCERSRRYQKEYDFDLKTKDGPFFCLLFPELEKKMAKIELAEQLEVKEEASESQQGTSGSEAEEFYEAQEGVSEVKKEATTYSSDEDSSGEEEEPKMSPTLQVEEKVKRRKLSEVKGRKLYSESSQEAYGKDDSS